MKLPGIEYNRQVQSLGREDPYNPIRTAAAYAQTAAYAGSGLKSIGAIAVKLGGYLVDQENKYAEHESQMAIVAAAKEMQDVTKARQTQGKIPVEEMPEALRAQANPGTYEVDQEGELHFNESADVNYYEYALEMYDNDVASIGKKYAANLKTNVAKKAFELAWAKSSVRARGGVINEAVAMAREDSMVKTVVAAEELANIGDIASATAMIRSNTPHLFSPAAAQEHITRLTIQGATAGPLQAMMDNDIMAMEAHHDALSNPDYKGPLNIGQRARLVTTLEANIDTAKREAKTKLIDSAKAGPIQAMMDGDISAMSAHRDLLANPNYKGPLNFEQRMAMINSLESRAVMTRAANSAGVANERAKIAGALKIGVDNAEVSHSDLESALDQSIITPSQYISWGAQLNENIQKKIAETNLYEGFSTAIANQVPIDDSGTEAKEALNQFWSGPMEGTYEAAKLVAVNSNVMPSDATNKMLMDSNSNDPEKLEAAANFYLEVIDADKGHVFKGVEGDVGDTLRTYSELRRGGYDPTLAFQEVTRVKTIPPAARAAIATTYPKHSAENSKWLESQKAEWTSFGEPAPPAEMIGEFDRFVKNNYLLNGGDIEKARNAAVRQMDSKWSRTRVNPNGVEMLMKHTPERVLGLPADLIEQDVATFVGEYADPEDGIEVENAMLVSDNATNSNPEKNGWAVMYYDEFDMLRYLTNANGDPVRYRPTRATIIERSRVEPAKKELERKRDTLERNTRPVREEMGDILDNLPAFGVPSP